MSDKTPIIKLVAKVVAGIGTSKVVNDIIVNNTNIETKTDALKVWTGCLVLGSLVTEQVSKHVESRVDAAMAWYEDRKDSTPAA